MHHEREVHEHQPQVGEPPGRPPDRLKAERVQLRLAALPGWELTSDGESITRVFQFRGSNTPLLFAALVTALGEEAGQLPAMTIVGHTVVCHLTTLEAGGVTEADLELAGRIGLVQ